MRRRLVVVASVLGLLAAACGGAAVTTPPAPVGEPMVVPVIGDGPVIEGGVVGPEGYPNDYPGAIVRDPDGTYHLYRPGDVERR